MKRLAILLSAAMLAACSGSIDPVEPPSALSEFKPGLKLDSRWHREVGGGAGGKYLKLMPLLDGERLVVSDRYGRVKAFHSLSGDTVWHVELGREISTAPGEAGDLLLFGGGAEVFALEKGNGKLRWSSPLGSEVLSRPVSHDGIIVIHAVDGTITALKQQDGSVLWRHQEEVPSLSVHGSGQPLIDGNVVYVGTASGQVIALGLQSGALLWRATIATPRGRTELERMVDVDADMVVSEGVLYVAAFQGAVAAVQAANGRLLWSREISTQSGIVADEQAIYLSDEAGDVWALLRGNGATLWKQERLHRRALSSPTQQGRYLILGDYDGYLHWLNKQDGTLTARTRVRNFREHYPVEDVEETNRYPEERGLLVPPLVEGTRVYGFDRRGVLDVYDVSVLERSE